MPVRHGKSELVSHWLPVWYLSLFPTRDVILTSYEADFAASWGRKIRASIEEHGRALGLSISRESAAAHRWQLRQGGIFQSAGRGGPVTGKGAHLLIGDDLVKNWEEANSTVFRESTDLWWRSTALTRLEPGGSAVIVMSRWNEDDLVGRLKSRKDENWQVIHLAALAEEDDPLGREVGDALWPDRYSREELEAIRVAVGPSVFAALYQQRPQPAEGALIKRHFIRYYTARVDAFVLHDTDGDRPVLRDNGFRFGTADLAISLSQMADYTVLMVWQLTNEGDLVLLDRVRERMEGPDQLPLIERLMQRYEVDYFGIERVAYQASIIQAALRQGICVLPLEADRDKVTRARTLEARMAAGKVYFPKDAPWLDELENELLAFPTGKHDDQVDAAAYAAMIAARPGPGIELVSASSRPQPDASPVMGARRNSRARDRIFSSRL